MQAYGSKVLDASLLLLPIVGFLPPSDPRIEGTVRAVERRLLVDGVIFRYATGETQDGLPPGESAFLACSFWFVDNLILQGRLDEAHEMFERLLALRNDVGLLSEEYDPDTRRQMGNFPQAFSHVSLVNTAYNLTRHEGPAEERGAGVGEGLGPKVSMGEARILSEDQRLSAALEVVRGAQCLDDGPSAVRVVTGAGQKGCCEYPFQSPDGRHHPSCQA